MLPSKSLLGVLLGVTHAALIKLPTKELLPLQVVNNSTNQIDALLAGTVDESTYQALFSILNQIKPTATPTTIARKSLGVIF